MQEKIAELMWARGERYEDSPDLHMNPMTVKVIAHAIAKLFERKVIWEGTGKLQHVKASADGLDWDTWVTIDGYSGSVALLNRKVATDGQRVRVVVEEIDDKKPTD